MIEIGDENAFVRREIVGITCTDEFLESRDEMLGIFPFIHVLL